MNPITLCVIIFALTLISFALNKIPASITSLLGMLLLVFTGVLDVDTALKCFGNTNVIVIVSMFVIAAGLNRTSFIDNLSDGIVKISGGSFKRAYLGYLIIALALTNFLNSPLTVFAITFPLCFSMCQSFGVSPSKTMYPLAVVCICCCAATPLSAAITSAAKWNGFLESFGVTEYTVMPMDYMIARFPIAILVLIWAYFVGYKNAPAEPVVPIEVKTKAKAEKTPLSKFSEFMGCFIFFATVALMLTAQWHKIPNWQITLTGAVLTVVCKVLTEKEAIAAIPASVALMYVGALALANAMNTSGAGEAVGNWLAGLLGGTTNNYVLGGAFFLISFLITQVMLNASVTNIFIPVCILCCQALGANPVGPMLLVYSGSLSAILTPLATPAIPMAMGAGGYDIRSIIKQGWLLSVILTVFSIAYVMTVLPAF